MRLFHCPSSILLSPYFDSEFLIVSMTGFEAASVLFFEYEIR